MTLQLEPPDGRADLLFALPSKWLPSLLRDASFLRLTSKQLGVSHAKRLCLNSQV